MESIENIVLSDLKAVVGILENMSGIQLDLAKKEKLYFILRSFGDEVILNDLIAKLKEHREYDDFSAAIEIYSASQEFEHLFSDTSNRHKGVKK